MTAAGVAPPRGTVGVAFSGGRDSLALLHATCRAARQLGLQVLAIHVHHGLLPEADGWERAAGRLCARWRARGLPLQLRSERVTGAPAAGESVEAWARRVRYTAVTSIARDEGVNLVLLGHHRRDQAETVLLQALRGAGPRGLAAMPRSIVRDGITWARPWLDTSREAIEAYLRRHRLKSIEDPTNADQRLARGRLRSAPWPALVRAFPDAEVALAAVGRRAQEAEAVLAEVGASDLAATAERGVLHVERWLRLSPARRGNVIRAWLRDRLGRGAAQTLVDRLLTELPSVQVGRWPLSLAEDLALYRGRLSVTPRRVARLGPVMSIDLSSAGQFAVEEWSGRFDVQVAGSKGVAAWRLRHLRLAPRGGGERFMSTPAGVIRSLKKQYQARAVPPAERRGPLVWSGDDLLYVPGLGMDARFWASPGEPQLTIEWIEVIASE